MIPDPTPLQESIARALVLSPYVRGQLSKIGPVMKRREAERIALAAAVLPIIAAEVRKAQADALREAADEDFYDGDMDMPVRGYAELYYRAERYEQED